MSFYPEHIKKNMDLVEPIFNDYIRPIFEQRGAKVKMIEGSDNPEDFNRDVKCATDLEIIYPDGRRITCALRILKDKYDFVNKRFIYKFMFTPRCKKATGFDTELHKLMKGIAHRKENDLPLNSNLDYPMYTMQVGYDVFGDDVAVRAYMSHSSNITPTAYEKTNNGQLSLNPDDNTWFAPVGLNELVAGSTYFSIYKEIHRLGGI